MRIRHFVGRNLVHFWRTNLAVLAGAASTVGVLSGALLVGDSVRASLRDLALLRLGQAAHVLTSENFFPDTLAERMHNAAARQREAAPLIVLEGLATHESSQRRASNVQVYGVDERFWKFHHQPNAAPQRREALLSPALAAEFGASPGHAILVRVRKPSAIPVESLHGRKDDLGRTVRLTLKAVLPATELGEFSIRPAQGEVRAVFVPLERLQADLGQEGKANTLLLSEGGHGSAEPDALLKQSFALEDAGLRLRVLEAQRVLHLDSERLLLDDYIVERAQSAARAQQFAPAGIFTYLANTLRMGNRQIPYSLATALDPVAPLLRDTNAAKPPHRPPLWLNDWAMRDLGAQPGQTVTMEYYVWKEGGRLATESAEFAVRGAVPVAAVNADRALAPAFPGIADSPTLSDWDPPFPVDLNRIRPRDEDYWKNFRTTPKAFLRLADGQKLWGTRFGKWTALRFEMPPPPKAPPQASPDAPARPKTLQERAEAFSMALREQIDPARAGFTLHAARREGVEASQGAVNFSAYFFYFSFFLVVSGMLLTGLFFKLGVEQRVREIGLLRAVGFPPEKIRAMFLAEGALLAGMGSLLGVAGALAYGALMMHGLRTWWVGAVGTTLLRLHVEPVSLLLGAMGGMAAALLSVWMALRGLRLASPRDLLAGELESLEPHQQQSGTRRLRTLAVVFALCGLLLLLAAALGWIAQVPGFFGCGASALAAFVFYQWHWLASPRRGVLHGHGWSASAQMGLRNAGWRPGRSLLCIVLIASSTFTLVAVDAFRRKGAGSLDPRSGTGGFPLLADTLLPMPYDPKTRPGQESLGLREDTIQQLAGVKFLSFRVRAGDDASCLNLYQPRDPRVLAAPAELLQGGRFSFSATLAESAEEKQNPWKLLQQESSDGALPAFVDANSLTYVLQRKLGDEFVLDKAVDPATGKPVRLRIAGALADSIFQSEFIVSEKNFLRVFPYQPGFRFFLLEPPPGAAATLTAALEEEWKDFGFDMQPAGERLAVFHRVENTYISTFQALGGLGLLLGTVGLAAVLLRNVLERRRELALLRAMGYRTADLTRIVLAENLLLLVNGLGAGVLSALLAIAPALLSRGGAPLAGSLGALLLAVLLTGLAASLLAVLAVKRAPLLAALRSE
jgi:hypothetical protein